MLSKCYIVLVLKEIIITQLYLSPDLVAHRGLLVITLRFT